MNFSRWLDARKWSLNWRLASFLTPWYAHNIPAKAEVQLPVRRFGTGGASYAVCEEFLSADSVVYSCGVGNDISFDRDVIARLRCEVHAFDPTAESAEFLAAQITPPKLLFYGWAVTSRDGEISITAIKPSKSRQYLPATVLNFENGRREQRVVPAYRLSTIARKLGHSRIDLLKLDIEGAEYELLRDLAASSLQVDQIALEFHPYLLNVERTGWMIGKRGWQTTLEAIELLRSAGYLIAAVSDRRTEFSFVHQRLLESNAVSRAA